MSQSLQSMKPIISAKRFLRAEYRLLAARLLEFVWKYSNKVYVPSGRMQEGPYVIQTGVWKFFHYYNILRGMEEECLKFVKEECVPGMEELKIPITGGWRLVMAVVQG